MYEPDAFDAAFQALCEGRSAFRWQRRLFYELCQGNVPARCTLPTGLGKTSVIPIWLIALAHSVRPKGSQVALPRRLVYIVNRRTVVDQATDDAKRLLARIYRSGHHDNLPWATNEAIAQLGLSDEPLLLGEHAPAMAVLRDALSCLSGDDGTAPLAVSTLRGELADNGEWKVNPARPAIVIGTVDMVGSKLLFSGYADGRYGRAHHAGVIGQDALIVHDEGHLSPAFSELLRSIEREQQRERERGGDTTVMTRPVRVMELSATTRRNADPSENGAAFGIENEDAQDTVIQQRLTASKRLSLVGVEAAGKKDAAFTAKIAERAAMYDDARCRVLAYVRSPETAAAVRDALAKAIVEKGKAAGMKVSNNDASNRIGLLSGTIRGYERDQLARSNLFKTFKSDPNRSRQLDGPTLYLVSTSAGEVGVDLDADHLVCDPTTLDSMAQRLGRVNRLGGDGRSACITVVHERARNAADGKGAKARKKKQSLFGAALAATREILHSVADSGADVSPAALSRVLESDEAKAAFSPTPTILPATDILFDAWSLTSIRDELPGRPEVAPYLHGIADWQPPETYVAWRADVIHIAEATETRALEDDALETILEKYPLKSWERLRETLRWERSTRRWVFDKLTELAERERGQEGNTNAVGDMPAIVVEPNGTPTLTTVRKAGEMDLRFRTVILPVEAAGLSDDGTLDPKAEKPVRDVADERPRSSLRAGRGAERSGANTGTADDAAKPAAIRLRVLLHRGADCWTAEYLGARAHTGAPAFLAEPSDDRAELTYQLERTLGLQVKYVVPIGDGRVRCRAVIFHGIGEILHRERWFIFHGLRRGQFRVAGGENGFGRFL